MDFNIIKNNMLKNEDSLSKYATKSRMAIRINEKSEDIRPAFFHDTDSIIHSLSYTRYIDKTQVFAFERNDNLSKRIVHVQLVSKIARTIGRALNLNEDLIEAISLGHDIGHAPLGHAGEDMLNEISMRELGKMFNHNIQSVREFMVIENFGMGKNLTIQTLDGIMCHNGEMLESILAPENKSLEEFINQYYESYINKETLLHLKPMTLEGCVVRISDVIGYIGRDIEDAINVGLIKRDDIPSEIVEVLGKNNSEIVNTIIMDIINNSLGKNYIKLSDRIFLALKELLKFNYRNIYSRANSTEKLNYYRSGMNKIFTNYLNDLKVNNYKSDIFNVFLNNMCDEYKSSTLPPRIVIDYIAGMTDDYLEKMIEKYK